jgi:hypothetical protein
MAPLTPDDLRRRLAADVDPATGSRGHGASKRDGERPIRHLVIFPARVLGAASVASRGR